MIRRRATRYPKEVEEWWSALEYCQVCFLPRRVAERMPRGFQHLHIVPKSQRVSNDRGNIVGGCWRCHGNQHGQNMPGFSTLTVPMLMAVKLESDPDFYNPDELQSLWTHGLLPQPRPLPIEYREERLRNRPMAFTC